MPHGFVLWSLPENIGRHSNRESVQSSLRAQFGPLHGDFDRLNAGSGEVRQLVGIRSCSNNKDQKRDGGISKMMAGLYYNFAAPLTDQTTFDWNALQLAGAHSARYM